MEEPFAGGRLNGWKAIASYFGRDERTVMRWAAQRGMPVHRIPGGVRAPIYALPEELASWFSGAGNADATPPAQPPDAPPAERRHSPLRRHAVAALAATALLAGGTGAWIANSRPPARRAPTHLSADHAAELAYLQARYDLSTRTAAGLQRAADGFEKAISRDAKFAAAHAGLAEVYLLLREYGNMADAEAYPRAQRAAEAAVSLNPDLASAHRALAFVAFWWRGDVATARREFARALALEPDNAETHHWLATAFSANGEAKAALDEIMLARRLDPQSTAILADFGFILYTSGNAAEGAAIIRQVATAAPRQASPHSYLAAFALVAGDGPTYLQHAQIRSELRGDTAGLAALKEERVAFARGGVDAIIRERLAAATGGAARGSACEAAGLAALIGDRERALALLSEARRERDPAMIALPGDLRFAKLKSDSRFASYFQRVSLRSD